VFFTQKGEDWVSEDIHFLLTLSPPAQMFFCKLGLKENRVGLNGGGIV